MKHSCVAQLLKAGKQINILILTKLLLLFFSGVSVLGVLSEQMQEYFHKSITDGHFHIYICTSAFEWILAGSQNGVYSAYQDRPDPRQRHLYRKV